MQLEFWLIQWINQRWSPNSLITMDFHFSIAIYRSLVTVIIFCYPQHAVFLSMKYSNNMSPQDTHKEMQFDAIYILSLKFVIYVHVMFKYIYIYMIPEYGLY